MTIRFLLRLHFLVFLTVLIFAPHASGDNCDDPPEHPTLVIQIADSKNRLFHPYSSHVRVFEDPESTVSSGGQFNASGEITFEYSPLQATCEDNSWQFSPVYIFSWVLLPNYIISGWWNGSDLTENPNAAMAINVYPGETTTVSMNINAGRYVSGIVTNISGDPLEGIQVSIDDDSWGEPGGFHNISITDSNGDYVIRSVPEGAFYIYTSISVFVNPNNYVNLKWNQDNGSPDGDYAEQIHLGSDSEDEVENINFRLPVGGAISGRVTNREGAPVVGITVNAFAGKEVESEWLARSDTDENGNYKIERIRPGDVYLLTMDFGSNVFEQTFYDGDKTTGTREDAVSVPVTSNYEIEHIDITANLKNKPNIPSENRGIEKDNPIWGGDPVNMINGNVYLSNEDLVIPSINGSFSFIRDYNSISSQDYGLGVGWWHNYMIKLVPPANTTDPIQIYDHQSRLVTFVQYSPGNFQAYRGEYSKIEKNQDGFVWKKRNQKKYHFNLQGQLQRIENRNGKNIQLNYNEDQRIISVVDVTGRSFALSYDISGRLSDITDNSGRTAHYEYDVLNNLILFIDPEGTETIYEYADPNDPHNMTKVSTEDGYSFNYIYDDQDRCISSSGVNGELGNTFEYHPELSYTLLIDAKNNTTQKKYDEYGLIKEITYPDEDLDFIFWDDNHNLTGKEDSNGVFWTYEYDIWGNILTITDPDDNSKLLTYDENNNLLSVTDENGHTTNYTYDLNGNLTCILKEDNIQSELTYNAFGQILTLINETGAVSTFEYDAQGNMTSVTDPEGNKITYTYDSLGRIMQKTDAKGQMIHFLYDALNRITRITDPLNHETVKTHKPAGMGSLTDPNINTTTFKYNSLNQLTETIDPFGYRTLYAYDLNGNLRSKTDAANQTTQYEYDNMNRLVQKTFPNGDQIFFLRGENGFVYEFNGDTIPAYFQYDRLGRLKWYQDGFHQNLTYAYDNLGNLTSMKFERIDKTINYQYDSQNRLTQITDWSGRQTHYTYNGRGLLVSVTLPNGTKTEYEYDDADKIIALNNLKSDNTSIASFLYAYDKNGNLISESVDPPVNIFLQSNQKSFEYGKDNRLTRVVSNSEEIITHDENGDMYSKESVSYEYDYESRLTKVSTPRKPMEL